MVYPIDRESAPGLGRLKVMNDVLVSKGIRPSIDLRAFVSDRISFGLDRFREAIRCIKIKLSDSNGPRGGIDKLCKVVVTLNGGYVIVRESASNNIQTAISEAVHRIEQGIARRVRKLHRYK